MGVGGDLRRDPRSQPNKRGGQSLAQAKDSLEARKGDLYVLPNSTPPLGSLGAAKRGSPPRPRLPRLLAALSAPDLRAFRQYRYRKVPISVPPPY